MSFARIVLVKLQPEQADGAGRAALAAAVRAALAGDPDLLALRVELPADADAERSWDLAVRLELASAEAFERLAAREHYRGLFARELPARAVVVKAWSFVPA
jgi:hypothetical protein